MFFYKENQKEESLILIYIMTLEESFVFERFLEKVVQFGWFVTFINSSPFLLLKLGIVYIKDYNSSWM